MSVRAALVIGAVGLALAATVPVPHETTPPRMDAAWPATDLTYGDLLMAGQGCGTERWSVKTASDSERNAVSTAQHQASIDALRGLRRPSTVPAAARIHPTELTEFVIAGTLTGYKLEADGDIHLVIANEAGRTMIAEIPDTRCVVAARFKTEIANVRKAFLARYQPASTMRNPHRAIRVRGIGFFDYQHGQTGVAPNAIELHPVLGLGFP